MVLNLTLADSQSDIKDIFEESSDEVPDRTAMELYDSYYTMISGRHLGTGITAIMQRIVALGSQLSNGSLCKIIVYREFTVIQVRKDLCMGIHT